MRILTVAMLLATAAVGSFMGTHAMDAEATAAVYDPKVAMEAIFYSKAVLCNPAKIATWTCESCGFNPGMKHVSVFTERQTQAYVGYDEPNNNIVVAIRGSSNLKNWLDDLTFFAVPYPPCFSTTRCRVHQGFYEVYKALSVDMLPAVRNLLASYPNARLFITGHSMGAAVSLHAALDLHAHAPSRDVRVYNFGQPRVGDKHFTAYAVSALPAGSQFRITHHRDPVPHVPPHFIGFLHTPHEVFYDNDGSSSFKVCSDSVTSEDDSCSNKYKLPVEVSDHLLYLGMEVSCKATKAALAVRSYTDLTNGEAEPDGFE